ncbi:Endonuclease/exonuclease/phosphatase [Trinorchestia longiramus]|nr:Endonuclease/exonuclease/phosphatase [Trinorchestia longiramus]
MLSNASSPDVWSPNSTDFNPIDILYRAAVERNANQTPCTNSDEFIVRIKLGCRPNKSQRLARSKTANGNGNKQDQSERRGQNKPRTGYPRKINDRAAQKLVQTVVLRPQTTREELKDDLKASGIEASKHTSSRALRRESLRSRTLLRTLLQKRNVQARLRYANDYLNKPAAILELSTVLGRLSPAWSTHHQLGRLVSESAFEQKDPGSNPAADMVDKARNTAWDLDKQPNTYRRSDAEEFYQTDTSKETITMIGKHQKMKRIQMPEAPLLWWYTNAQSYSSFITLDKRRLACPSKTVTSERLFSGAGFIYGRKDPRESCNSSGRVKRHIKKGFTLLFDNMRNPFTSLVDYHQLGRLVSESACEREDPGSNPDADMVDKARNTAWDLDKQPNNYRSNYPIQEWARINRGGGSLIYVKEKLQPQIKTKRATEKSEILHLNIQQHPGQTIKIGLVYRNPTNTAIEDDEFYDCLNIILSTPHDTLIMEDFNLPHINWTTRQSQAIGSKLIDLMNTNSLQQHVNKPTRGNNILDIVMKTTDLSINGLEVTDKIGDHQMIDFSLEVQVPNTRTQHKQVLDYKRANFELMKNELGSYNYEVLMNNKNAEECYMILKGLNANEQQKQSQNS